MAYGLSDPRVASPQMTPQTAPQTTIVGSNPSDNPKTYRPDAGRSMTDDEYATWQTSQRQSATGDPRTAPGIGQPQPISDSRAYDAQGHYRPGTDPAAQAPTAPAAPAAAAAPPSGPGYTPIDPSLYGLPYGEDIMRGLQSRVGDVLGRDPTTDPFYQRQSALADMMQRYATGQESVSQLQLRQAADANIAQQMAMAASARPGQAQLAALTAAQNAGTINTQLAGQSALAGIQERAAAQNALSGLLGTTRGQNLQFGSQQDQAFQQAMAQGLATSQLMQQGNMGFAGASSAQELAYKQMAQQLLIQQMQIAAQKGSPLDAGLKAAGDAVTWYLTHGGGGSAPTSNVLPGGVGSTGAPY